MAKTTLDPHACNPCKSYKITDLPSYEGTLSIKPGKKVYLALFPASDAPKASLESLFKKRKTNVNNWPQASHSRLPTNGSIR